MLKVFINRWCCVSVYIHILICKIKEMFVVFLFSKLLTFFFKKKEELPTKMIFLTNATVSLTKLLFC